MPCLPRGPSSRALCRRRHACHWLRKAPLYRFLNSVYRTSLFFRPTYRSTPSTATAPDSLPDICHPLMQLRNGGIYAIPNLARGIGASTRTSRMCSLSVAWAHTHHLAMPQQDGDEGHDGGEGGTSGERGAEDDATPNQWQRSGRCTPGVALIVCLMPRRASRPRCPDCQLGAHAAVRGKAQYRGPRCSCGRGMAGWGSGPAG